MNSAPPPEHVLADWRHWPLPEKPTVLRNFASGQNHQTWLMASAGQPFILKLFADHLAAEISLQGQQLAALSGLAPAVLYYDEPISYLLMEDIGQTSVQPDNLSPRQLQRLGSALATLHNLPATDLAGRDVFDLLAYCDAYLTTLPQALKDQHRALLPVLEQFLHDSNELCICHNDLVAENCFVTDQRAYFIDWEFTQLNNPWFDLAAGIYYWGLNETQSKTFLTSYRAGWDRHAGGPLCRAALCSVVWLDILWRVQKHGPAILPQLESRQADLQGLMQTLQGDDGG